MELVPRAVLAKDKRGLVKIVIDAREERILGVHILASLAADMTLKNLQALYAQNTYYSQDVRS